MTFTSDEVSILIRLAATLDPSAFMYPEARSVIEKCKSAVEQMPIRVSVVPA